MELSVIVVTYNQHDLLRKCLRSVLQSMEGIQGDVVVVDNASVDATPEVMSEEFPTVRYIRNHTNLHYTRAVNQGMRATSGRYAFLLNDDTEMAPDTFRKLIAFMDAHPRCGAVGPRMLSPTGDEQTSVHKFWTPFRAVINMWGITWRLRNHPWADGIQVAYPRPMTTRTVDWVCGGALFLRRIAIEALGYHDEAYLFYQDDPDIGMRMWAAGWEVWYCTDTHVMHHHGMSTVKTGKKARFELIAVRSRRHYYRKFHGVVGALAVEFCHGLNHLLRAAGKFVTGRRKEAREQWRKFVLLFEALTVPKEELEAIAGYRDAPFNGLGPTARTGDRDRSPRTVL